MKLVFIEDPTQDEQEQIEDKLLGFNASIIQGYSYDSFVYRIMASGLMLAGINCEIGGGWLYISGLWVTKQHRGKGLGETLLKAAEKKAMEEGCHGSHLYTYDFQAPDFYKKNGYKVFGELEKYCGHHAKLFMKKQLHSNSME